MKHLPGFPVIKASVFDLKIGTKVYDKKSKRNGIISDIRETSPENIEAFITLNGDIEVKASKYPQVVIIDEAS